LSQTGETGWLDLNARLSAPSAGLLPRTPTPRPQGQRESRRRLPAVECSAFSSLHAIAPAHRIKTWARASSPRSVAAEGDRTWLKSGKSSTSRRN